MRDQPATMPACPLLALPTELRLEIYSHTLLDSPTITISSAEVSGAYPDIVHRLYGSGRTPFSGLKLNHEPVIREDYDARLLSVVLPPKIPATSHDDGSNERWAHGYSACPALLLVNKQINQELRSHFNLKHKRNTSLYLSFPGGLHVFRTLTPSLLRQARSIHIAGAYTSTSYKPAHRAHLPGRCEKVQEASAYNGRTIPDSSSQLEDLIKSLCGPNARHELDFLEMRIYYTGEDSYSTVWGDDSSPIVVALRNIYTGDIGITVYRGQYGTGVHFTVRSNEENRRCVSTVWRRLEEGRRGEPACGTWVLDNKWPCWEDQEEVEGGMRVTSTALT
jgi:hypothetical protein